jgi:polygalacturonase
MTTWTPLPGRPGYEVSDTGRMRSITRLLPVVFRKPRVIGDSAPDQVITHPHTEDRDPMGTVIPPTRIIGSTQINILTFGAAGDGVTDDTAIVNAAIESLPADGGTIYFPNADYLIDAEESIKMKNHVRLLGDLEARLIQKAASVPSGMNVILASRISDFEIDGLTIIGDRDAHVGTTGEGGMGIRVQGSKRGTIKNTFASKCWGDGIVIGPWKQGGFIYSDDIIVSNVICTQNRRNGMSVGNATNVRTYDSDFTYSNGTSPQCGVDVEPDPDTMTGGYCDNVYFENCRFRHNTVFGFNIHNRARNVTIKKSFIEDNLSAGFESLECNGLVLDENSVKRNGAPGHQIGPLNKYVTVQNCVMGENAGRAARATPIEKSGVVPGTKTDLSVSGSPKTIGLNRYE